MIEMFKKNLIKIAKMKKKSFFIFVAFVFISIFLFWLTHQKHLSNIVSKTKLHIKSINSKLQSYEPSDEPEENSKDLEVDATYLELLGFEPNLVEPNLFKEEKKVLKDSDKESDPDVNKGSLNNNNNNINFNGRIPPLVTAFSRFSEKEKALIESKLKYFFNDLFLVYDLDLSSSEQLKVSFLIIFKVRIT